jgi:formylglycine-generating enzyme required for sulfatase activity/tRNA A-37 threonylcarbamoyl transferase component Bud32
MADSAQASHPSASQLAAFAQGALAAGQRAALQAHLTACPACRQALAALPGGAEWVSGLDAGATTAAPPAPASAGLTTLWPAAAVPAGLTNHPRYEILQLLGQGGMGAVYKARHQKMDRLVALKVIHARMLDNPKAVERFQREVKAAAKLEHPNIVRAYDADEAGGTHFLVMEFVEGTDLAKYVARKGPLPVAYACHFVRQVALALEHAHDRGMVHRDIKPHNLMLVQPPGQPVAALVKVMDFGLALLAQEGATASGLTGDNVLMGTSDYLAPEQAQDAHRADIRADVYSLGCTLYHLLAGRAPFAGSGTAAAKIMAHATAEVPLAELPAAVPAELRAVLAKMTAKEPGQRYQTPAEVAAALAPFIKKATTAKPAAAAAGGGAGTVAETVAAAPGAKRKRPPRWPVTVGVGAVVAVLLVVGVLALIAGRSRPPAEVAPGTKEPAAPVAKQPEKLPATFTNKLGMEFVLVPRGKSWLGGGGGTMGAQEVEIKQDFYLGKYEVTQGEWENVTGLNASAFKAVPGVKPEDQKRFPVENVSWDDAQEFIKLVNELAPEAGWVYRLPTAVEWEYACRGGPLSNRFLSAFDFYSDEPTNTLRPDQANFTPEQGKGLGRTCKVGSYPPNRLGLSDMHGNVWEWCDDEQKDDKGASQRVSRGGSWDNGSGICRAAARHALPPSYRHADLGLRLARVPVGVGGK